MMTETIDNSAQVNTTKFSLPKLMLHAEGAGVFLATIALYSQLDLAWWMYPLLLLVPDVFAVGYLINTSWGARIYNIGHTYILPLALGIFALVTSWSSGMGFALIWVGHIGMDRMLGYGMKYPENFKDTHLNRI